MHSCPSVALLDWSGAKSMAQPVRRTVFVVEQGVPVELEWDEWDERSMHAIATLDDKVVGTGRLLPADDRGTVRIGRMAVMQEFRGQGIGAAILAALLACAREQRAREALLHAQSYVAAFYRGFGFIERGDEFLEAGIAHVEMTLTLAARTPG